MIRRVLPGSRRLDLVVLGCALTLAALGVLFIASATTGTKYEGLAAEQAILIGVGVVAMTVTILFDYRMLLKFSFAIYCVSLLPLVYLLLFGERIANVRSWIRFGSFQFQPAELAKIATALLVAYLFENEDDARLHASTLFKLGAIVGTAVFSRVPAAGHRARHHVSAAALRRPLLRRAAGPRLDRHRADRRRRARERVVPAQGLPEGTHRDVPQPRQDLLGSGYQVRQSKIAVGSGGFSGRAFAPGRRASCASCRCSTPTSSWRSSPRSGDSSA